MPPAAAVLAALASLSAAAAAPPAGSDSARLEAASAKAIGFLFQYQQNKIRVIQGKDADRISDVADAEWRDVVIVKGADAVRIRGRQYDEVVAVLPPGWFDPEPDIGPGMLNQLGGRTALTVLALVNAGVSPNADRRLARAVDCLLHLHTARPGRRGDELQPGALGTYPTAVRAMALEAALRHLRPGPTADAVRRALADDGKRLAEGRHPRGGFSASLPPADKEEPDMLHTAWGVQGLWAAGAPEPSDKTWRPLAEHLLDMQSTEGGFALRGNVNVDDALSPAGVACLAILLETLFPRPRAGPVKPDAGAFAAETMMSRAVAGIEKGGDFLGRPRPKVDPVTKKKTPDPDGRHLWGAARVGTLAGRKRFGGKEWAAAGVAEALALQDGFGGWTGPGGPVVQTALHLMFLSSAAQPVLVNKLVYGGRASAGWQPYPRDAAGLAAWHSRTLGNPVRWQAVELSSLDDLSDAPVLYVSGAADLGFTDDDVAGLRKYVGRGGTLLFVAAGPPAASKPFADAVTELGRRLCPPDAYPDRQWAPLPKDHPLLRMPGEDPAVAAALARLPLLHMADPVRTFAVFCPEDVAYAWQFNQSGRSNKLRPEAFALFDNLRAYVWDRSPVPPPPPGPVTAGERPFAGTVRTKIRLGAVAFRSSGRIAGADGSAIEAKSDWDAAPQAWETYSKWLAHAAGVELEEVRGVPLTGGLDLATFDVLHLSGRFAPEFADAEKKALKAYLAGGGSLLIDSVGGQDAGFHKAMADLLAELFPGKLRPLADGHPLLAGREGFFDAAEPEFTRAMRAGRGSPPAVDEVLSVLMLDGRPAALLSVGDLSLAIGGQTCFERRGLTARAARRLVGNFLVTAGNRKRGG